MIGITLFISDLGWGGYTSGASRWYHVFEEGMTPYYTFDTVVGVSTWDGTGSRCSFSTPVDRADYILYAHSYDPQVDTGYAYYDGTYLVDLIDNWLVSLPGITGLRVLKFPLVVGDTWQATDTCLYPLNVRVPTGGDEDWDGIVDSVYFSPSYATLTYLSGDTAEISISPYIITFAYTGTSYDSDTTFTCCVENIGHFYLRIRYVRSIGMTYYSVDSLVFYQSYAVVDTSTTPWDTTFYPPARIGSIPDYLVWEYTTTAVAEREGSGTLLFTLRGRALTVGEEAEVFAADGPVARLKRGQSVRLRPGVYFVRTRRGTAKVVVR